MGKTPVLLTHGRAPGDIVVMSGLVRDFVRTYGDRYEVEVFTSCPSLWRYNPHVSRVLSAPRPGVTAYSLCYGKQINEADYTPLHFLTAFHRDFKSRTGMEVPVLEPKPDLHLNEQERNERPIEGRYWVIIAGGKSDFTCKVWSAMRNQQVVNVLRQFGIRFVQIGATYKGNWHPPLQGCLDLIGKTGLRDAIWLLQHADGVICPVTFFMHAAAALDKPCVCIAGGREHWWWEAYVNSPTVQNFGPLASGKVPVPHRYLHTQGLLPCCKSRGCWMNKVDPTQPDKHKMYCKKPADDGYGQRIPECMRMITVEHVVDAVLSYYEDGTLEPIGSPPQIIMPDGTPLNTKSLQAQSAPQLAPRTVARTGPPPPPTLQRPFVDLFAQPDELQSQAAAPPAEPPVVEPPIPKVAAEFHGQGTFIEGKNKAGQRAITEDPFEHEVIGGRFTICILMYGAFHELHKRCLNAILSTVPTERRQIRVALNEVCPETLQYIDRMKREGHIYKVYVNQQNIKKYPAMRKMFHDPDCPLTDKYVIWFDDDTIADKDPQWASKLAQTIANFHNEGRVIYGCTFVWTLHRSQIEWIKSRPWYRGRYFQLHNGPEAPNGNKICFPAGGFWALSTDFIKRADVPDPQIGHNGGDYMIMEQVRQNGGRLKHWNGQKQFVRTSSVDRRGVKEIHTGMPGWKPGGVPE